jgi:sigma-B regulation protein RsbU (phosphoserine phosphatase)
MAAMTSEKGSSPPLTLSIQQVPSLAHYYGIGIVATTIGIGVVILLNLFTPLELIPRHVAGLRHFSEWDADLYRAFGLRFAVILAAAYGPLAAALKWMLSPVAACLEYYRRGRTPPPGLMARGRRRLLNLPFIFIPVSIGLWVAIPAAIAAAAVSTGQMGARTSLILGFRASMIGLIVSTISFHRMEFYSRRRLIPLFFPEGRLADLKGAARLSIDRRIRLLFRLGSLVPMVILIVTLLTLQWEVGAVVISAEDYGRGILVFTLVLAAYFFIAGGVLHRAVSRSITRPVGEIIRVLRRVARGDLDQQVRVVSNDEVGYAGDVINQMTGGLQDRERLRRSLELAMAVQQRLLPAADPVVSGLDIAGKSVYCDETGGDYYDYLAFDDAGRQRLGVVIGDVAGHGIPSALVMASVRGFLRQRVVLGGGLSEIVTDVNRQLCRDMADTGGFMTLFVLVSDPAGQRLNWLRAGHEPAIGYDPAADRLSELKGSGMPLGVDEAALFEASTLEKVGDGFVVLLCTDGVFEARSPEGELFGRSRVHALLRKHAGRPARELLENIIAAVAAFRGDNPPEDDVTLVVVKNGPRPAAG